MVALRPEIAELIAEARVSRPIEVIRPEDLVHLTFSFVNLKFKAGPDGTAPILTRRASNRAAYLVVDCHSQHIIEEALFEIAPGYPIKDPTPPVGLPQGQPPPEDPDKNRVNSVPSPPPAPPVFASLSGSSRLVFKVTTEAIPYSTQGLLAAMS